MEQNIKIPDVIDMNVDINTLLSNYFILWKDTDNIICLRKNNKCILLAVESKTNRIYLHNLLINKKNIIIKSYSAQKIIDSIKGDYCGYVDFLINHGYRLNDYSIK